MSQARKPAQPEGQGPAGGFSISDFRLPIEKPGWFLQSTIENRKSAKS
jgi:hypothetical protein